MLAPLIIATLLAVAMLALLLPAARPMLVEVCRGVPQARFWTRFIGLALLLSVPAGVLLGYLFGHTLWSPGKAGGDQGTLRTAGLMLRAGLCFAGIVIAVLARWVLATEAQRAPDERTRPITDPPPSSESKGGGPLPHG